MTMDNRLTRRLLIGWLAGGIAILALDPSLAQPARRAPAQSATDTGAKEQAGEAKRLPLLPPPPMSPAK